MNVLKNFCTNSINYFKGFQKMKLKDVANDWTLWEKCWLFVSTSAIIIASLWTWDPTNILASWVALISSVTGIWCVVLAAKGKISNYIFGLINVVFYAWAAISWKLYGDFMLNAFYFLPMQFYGWYIWTKPDFRNKKGGVVAKFLSIKGKIIWGFIAAIAIVGYGFVLKKMGGLTPFFDSTSTVLSIIAMILMARRFVEQWVLWIIVDIATVIMWINIVFNLGSIYNIGILIMWISFLVNAIYGMYNWIMTWKKQEN